MRDPADESSVICPECGQAFASSVMARRAADLSAALGVALMDRAARAEAA